MPNGYDKNWARVCMAIDGFRQHFGRWPKGVRMAPVYLEDLTSDVLTPGGFATVSSIVELIAEEDAPITAFDETGAEYRYGGSEVVEPPLGKSSPFQGDRGPDTDLPAREFFGSEILREDSDD